MGRFLHDRGVHPDRMIASPAKRAWTTARLIADEVEYAEQNIDAEGDFYGAGVGDTARIVQSFTDEWSTAMIFGHNPTTTAFVNWLTQSDIDNVPTCGVAHVQIHTSSWTRLGDTNAELAAFYVPKELPD